MSAIARASAILSPSISVAGRRAQALEPRLAESRPTRRRQHGAIGLFGVLTLLLALVFTALAVDAGRLWYERRELQAIADLAALEAARNVGCGNAAGNVAAAAQTAAARNGFVGDLRNSPNVVEVGGLTTASGLRNFSAGTASDAVHVVATESVPASLVVGGFLGRQTLMSAEATARAEPSHASFSAGSYLLRLSNTGVLNQLLGGLLGSSLTLDALSYQGLANADVNLAQLMRAQGSVGSVDQLLATNMTVADVMSLTATAVGQNSAVAASLDQIQAAAVNNATLQLGQVLDVSVPASDAAGKVGINVLDLVTTTLLVANKDNVVALTVPVNLGGLANVNVTVDLIQPPQIAVGPPGKNASGQWCAQAKTAQVEVTAAATVSILVGLNITAQVAQGEAHLETLNTVSGATQAVIGASTGLVSGSATIKLAGIPVTVDLSSLLAMTGSGDLTYNVPTPLQDGTLPMTQSVSATQGSNLVTSIILAVLNPVLNALGIQLGGLDVTLEDIRYTGGGQLVI